ncbi:hypothetical protein [Oceaniovalibus sp. ACAM 378]|jgi:hypothetical protein|uniref:hypothetical protein n=1 Tax=Oceaniovalibus sp. ACAM 378 TaxID=2599923 RepID=UPI0011D37A1D|nr:hypothetical protein [Oceaniovalibus sp. ACAM 378]TYB89228.1 hypothetical protein FQ320_09990 [Oceaniovalibus sp. ACAM 378]
MFTIEHEFDATVITLVDEVGTHRQEDITLNVFEDVVTMEQLDARTDRVVMISLSMAQVRDLAAALNLPEGAYRLKR